MVTFNLKYFLLGICAALLLLLANYTFLRDVTITLETFPLMTVYVNSFHFHHFILSLIFIPLSLFFFKIKYANLGSFLLGVAFTLFIDDFRDIVEAVKP